MSPTPSPQPPASAEADLNDLLRAWFDAMLAQPVPEALLRRLTDLESGAPEPRP